MKNAHSLGTVSNILTIIWFGFYLFELYKRKTHDKLMIGFLHGIKPLVENMSKRPTTTGADWQPLLPQINNMLEYLQPPRGRVRQFLTRLIHPTRP